MSTDTTTITLREMQLALWLTPQAIRDHFDGGDSDVAEWVAQASDTDLEEVGEECLSGDVLYNAFHDSLMLSVEERLP